MELHGKRHISTLNRPPPPPLLFCVFPSVEHFQIGDVTRASLRPQYGAAASASVLGSETASSEGAHDRSEELNCFSFLRGFVDRHSSWLQTANDLVELTVSLEQKRKSKCHLAVVFSYNITDAG